MQNFIQWQKLQYVQGHCNAWWTQMKVKREEHEQYVDDVDDVWLVRVFVTFRW